MSKDAAEAKAKGKQQNAAKTSAPTSNRPKSDGKDFGDACLHLKIKEAVNVTETRVGAPTNITRLTLIIPPGAHAAKDTEGFVEGMQNATVSIVGVAKGVATAEVNGTVDPSAFANRDVIMSCAKPEIKTISGKLVRSKDKDGSDIQRVETWKDPKTQDLKSQTIMRINVGTLHGVKGGMTGYVKGYTGLTFKLDDARIRDTWSDIELNGAPGSVVDVVINELPRNRK